MVLDLNTLGNSAEKIKEQYIAEAAQQVAQMIKISAIQIKNNRDAVRRIILESENYTAAEFNEFIGEEASEQLAGIDLESTELLAKVSV